MTVSPSLTFALEDGAREPVADLALDHPLQRPGPEGGVEALPGQQPAGIVGHHQHDALGGQPILKMGELEVHDVGQVVLGQRAEPDDVVDPVDELGLEERRADRPAGSTS